MPSTILFFYTGNIWLIVAMVSASNKQKPIHFHIIYYHGVFILLDCYSSTSELSIDIFGSSNIGFVINWSVAILMFSGNWPWSMIDNCFVYIRLILILSAVPYANGTLPHFNLKYSINFNSLTCIYGEKAFQTSSTNNIYTE